mmetsp:Transcript_13723/g.27408  ORF Transcript_13723/g.27408 Transcript_13723/m.27408 type:complete len:277 (-) Transcript_13723:85-915(-)
MYGMFGKAYLFNGDISEWDTSWVYSMAAMFTGAYSFNGDISNWDTSSVLYMYGMFYEAYSFNRDISSLDVSHVESMKWMFKDASSFNVDISEWDVGQVTEMWRMFSSASSFNQSLQWSLKVGTNTYEMFAQSDGSFKTTHVRNNSVVIVGTVGGILLFLFFIQLVFCAKRRCKPSKQSSNEDGNSVDVAESSDDGDDDDDDDDGDDGDDDDLSEAVTELYDSPPCCICKENQPSHAFVPCGHQSVCMTCAVKLKKNGIHQCPVCRTTSTGLMKIFI